MGSWLPRLWNILGRICVRVRRCDLLRNNHLKAMMPKRISLRLRSKMTHVTQTYVVRLKTRHMRERLGEKSHTERNDMGPGYKKRVSARDMDRERTG